MGFYYATYICNGTFINSQNAILVDEIHLQSIDPVIENKEWQQGFVSVSEFDKLKLGRLESCENSDVFMAETVWCSLDPSDKLEPKYRFILVSRGVRFISNTAIEGSKGEEKQKKIEIARKNLVCAHRAVETAKKELEKAHQSEFVSNCVAESVSIKKTNHDEMD